MLHRMGMETIKSLFTCRSIILYTNEKRHKARIIILKRQLFSIQQKLLVKVNNTDMTVRSYIRLVLS